MKFVYLISAMILLSLVSCDYDRATFYYADIAPKAPVNVSITTTNSTSATIKWTPADDSAYPAPDFNIYTKTGNVTNLNITVSNDIREHRISSLESTTTYSAWVQATNRAGGANSSSVTFTTP